MTKNKTTLEYLLNFVESGGIKFRKANQKYDCISLDESIEYPKIIKYAVVAYNYIVSNLENWEINSNCFDIRRAITRGPYDAVHSNSIDTSMISESAFVMKKTDPKFLTTKEHIYMPQFTVRLALDNPEKYLKDPNDFFKLFIRCCQTREVTAEENRKLSGFMKSGKVIDGKKYDKIQIKCPLSVKYEACGIKMLQREKGLGWKNKPVQPVESTILTPDGYDEYEAQFLVDEFE